METFPHRQPKVNENSLEQNPPKKVVRVFLLQPTSVEDIQTREDVVSLSTVKVMMIRKNEQARNPGQVMPVGGNVESGEDEIKAAVREVFEETHLFISPDTTHSPSVVPGVKRLSSPQTYSFTSTHKETREQVTEVREAHYFVARLYGSTFDNPYPLNNDVDKIASFPRYSPEELKELFDGGDGLDSLQRDARVREERGATTNSEQVDAVHEALLQELQEEDAKRKIRILELLRNRGKIAIDSQTLQEYKIETSYGGVQALWQEICSTQPLEVRDVQECMRFLELEELLLDVASKKRTKGESEENVEFEKTKGLPTVHMMFSLMLGFELDKHVEGLLSQHPHLKKLITISKVFYLYNELQKEDGGNKGAVHRLLQRMLGMSKSDEQVNEADIFSFIEKEYDVSFRDNESFSNLGHNVDVLFDSIQQQSKIDVNTAHFSVLNEIQNTEFKTLIRLAFQKNKKNSLYEKQIAFEAQRKLLLMHLFMQVRSYYDSVCNAGIEPLDAIEFSLEKTRTDVERLKKAKRIIALHGTDYEVSIERNRKGIDSLMRKVLVRDEWSFDGSVSPADMYNDIYRESYIFDIPEGGDADAMMQEVEIENIPFSMTDGKNKSLTKYKTQKVVHDFISSLVEKARMKGESIEIIQFKGLPKKGEALSSAGIGGGGEVRFCKFYIKHTDKSGVSRVREVQLFLPKEVEGAPGKKEWVSGEHDFKFKKNDDTRYAIDRLFTHGRVYSLIELLFPYAIYGDRMKALFSKDGSVSK